MLNPKIKKNGGVSIIAILTVVAHVFLAMYGEGELEFADTLTFALEGLRLPGVLDATGKNIMPVEFTSSLILISSPILELMGGLDLSVQPGDVLIFRKDDSLWVEAGRYLIE